MPRRGTDGFVLRDGTFIAIDDVQGMYGQGVKWLRTPQKVAGLMWSLGRHDEAFANLPEARGLEARPAGVTEEHGEAGMPPSAP